jgi:hypothetical protein
LAAERRAVRHSGISESDHPARSCMRSHASCPSIPCSSSPLCALCLSICCCLLLALRRYPLGRVSQGSTAAHRTHTQQQRKGRRGRGEEEMSTSDIAACTLEHRFSTCATCHCPVLIWLSLAREFLPDNLHRPTWKHRNDTGLDCIGMDWIQNS